MQRHQLPRQCLLSRVAAPSPAAKPIAQNQQTQRRALPLLPGSRRLGSFGVTADVLAATAAADRARVASRWRMVFFRLRSGQQAYAFVACRQSPANAGTGAIRPIARRIQLAPRSYIRQLELCRGHLRPPTAALAGPRISAWVWREVMPVDQIARQQWRFVCRAAAAPTVSNSEPWLYAVIA